MCCDAEGMVCSQMVNFNAAAQLVDVEVLHLASSPASMTVTTLNSTDGAAENSFAEPFLVGTTNAVHDTFNMCPGTTTKHACKECLKEGLVTSGPALQDTGLQTDHLFQLNVAAALLLTVCMTFRSCEGSSLLTCRTVMTQCMLINILNAAHGALLQCSACMVSIVLLCS